MNHKERAVTAATARIFRAADQIVYGVDHIVVRNLDGDPQGVSLPEVPGIDLATEREARTRLLEEIAVAAEEFAAVQYGPQKSWPSVIRIDRPLRHFVWIPVPCSCLTGYYRHAREQAGRTWECDCGERVRLADIVDATGDIFATRRGILQRGIPEDVHFSYKWKTFPVGGLIEYLLTREHWTDWSTNYAVLNAARTGEHWRTSPGSAPAAIRRKG